MKNNEVPEGESDNPKGDPDDEKSGEDTLERRKKQMTLAEFGSPRVASVTTLSDSW